MRARVRVPHAVRGKYHGRREFWQETPLTHRMVFFGVALYVVFITVIQFIWPHQ
jgi:hypothetical protein